MPQGTGGTATTTKGLLGEIRIRKRNWYQSWQEGQGKFLACFQPLWGPHLGMGTNTVRHCSVTPHTSRAWRGCPFSQKWVGKEGGFSEAEPFAFTAPAMPQQNTGLKRWRGMLKVTQHPRACLGLGAGVLDWELSLFPRGLRDASSSFQSRGYYSLVQRGSWHLVAGLVPARAAQESGGRVRTGAVSVGNRGLQLL